MKNINDIKPGDNIKLEVNGVIRRAENAVIRVNDKFITVQLNEPSSIVHNCTIAIPKETNEFKMRTYGISIYKIYLGD